MMIPGVITMIPQFLVLKLSVSGRKQYFRAGRPGLHQSLCSNYSSRRGGAYAVFHEAIFETLPDDLAEAARMDGR